MTEREAILHEAAELTGGDRDRTYGDPAPNLALAYRLFGEIMTANCEGPKPMGEAEAGALMNACIKLGRIAVGPVYNRDNYVDAAAYMAMAGEVAQIEVAQIEVEHVDAGTFDMSEVWHAMREGLNPENIGESEDD